jgi:all-trans-retinol 13,14-reductase
MSQTDKTKSWDRTLPPGTWDYIVIGSGMGGMTTAALLATIGRRVLVLEQHYVPGGFTQMFRRPGYTWDVGVHAVGEVTEHSMTGRLLSRLTNGTLRWQSLGQQYEEFHYPEDFRLDYPDNPDQFRENLVRAFPKERAGIERYLHSARTVASGMKGYYLARALPKQLAFPADQLLARSANTMLQQRTMDVIRKLTGDRRLHAVMTGQWGYYGSPPARSSFAMQALVVKHFLWGAYYPVGGSQQIARTLLGSVARAGGWTRIYADVAQILIEGGKAVGVRLRSGEEIRAKRIVSAAGILATATRLLPPQLTAAAPWVRTVRQLTPAPAHLCLYIGFKGDIRRAGCSGANKWFYRTWDLNLRGWNIADPDRLEPADILYCSFPSLKYPEHDPGPEQRHTGEVVTFVPWESFSRWTGSRWHHRGADYDQLKEKLQQALLDQFLAHVPGLRPMVDYVELSTPLSTDHFVRPVAGSIYGLEPTPQRFRNPWLRPRSPIQNLFFSGGEVTTVGVMGAMMGGVLCALSAEPLGVLNVLRKL